MELGMEIPEPDEFFEGTSKGSSEASMPRSEDSSKDGSEESVDSSKDGSEESADASKDPPEEDEWDLSDSEESAPIVVPEAKKVSTKKSPTTRGSKKRKIGYN